MTVDPMPVTESISAKVHLLGLSVLWQLITEHMAQMWALA